MFMCRSLEEFREAYVRLSQIPLPEPDEVGPVVKRQPPDGSEGDGDDEDGDQPNRYRLVVKREAY